MAHAGGTSVTNGFYWSMQAWDMSMIPAQGGVLPGGTDRHYTRIPTFLFLLMAPVMGALYVVFLPFIGFALILGYAARGLKTMIADGFMNIAASVAPKWAPAGAYLANRQREKAATAEKRAAAKQNARH